MQYERPYNDEINIGDLFTKIGEYGRYLLRKWWVILIVGLVFSMAFRYYKKVMKEKYTSYVDFAVKGGEGSTTSSNTSYGFGISTGAEFTNEFFLGIIQSRRLIKEALVQKEFIDGNSDAMCKHYIDMYPRWSGKKKIKDFLLVSTNIDSLSRYEDSVLNVIYDEIIDNDLTVEFNEDIDMNELTMESVSYEFCQKFASWLTSAASDFYINNQIKIELETVDLIQHRADSIKGVMQSKENYLAGLQDRSAFNIKAQGLLEQGRLLRDIELLNLEYAEIYGQLELAKFALRNKTPLVSIVDSPKFATVKEKENLILYMIMGFILGSIICIIVILIRKYIRDTVDESRKKRLLIEQHSKSEAALIEANKTDT